MDIDKLLAEAEQKFENAKADMYRFQGEFRAFSRVKKEQEQEAAVAEAEVTNEAATVVAEGV